MEEAEERIGGAEAEERTGVAEALFFLFSFFWRRQRGEEGTWEILISTAYGGLKI